MEKKVNISTEAVTDVERVSATVSQNLKLFRKQNGLTLDELSRKSGVSKGMLVEIEKGSANPSIATLCRAATALGVSVADFVGVAVNVPVRIVPPEDASILWRGPKGGSATLLVGTHGPDEIELWRWTLFPGEVFESPGHSAGTLELLNVETGALTLKLADSEHLVKAGSSVLARTEDKHAYMNCGKEELRFVMTVAELQRPRVRTGL
ncbi:helix-turn-helix domain-containing protein [Rhizobium leguminosarum]|jgi:transcriptional regulator with XRE-family HTH domain|uniref:XRE family transcriptional regulator n=4 Tax=Rhizobium/Agrobacterium group TaxID=227290 RepID=A0A154IGX1_RHILE|nr:MULTISPECIES: helix-turn-helix domain-containing protein [Rhizobium/Agrobacterium group]ANP90879.1 XRE family transcriptional regulator [Rhizobium leguminosarum]API55075.1 XRE family transcriptional regulator [Rhizobium leguminosarum]KAB1082196.1 helix-turn-helix domain-containing protein [Neorhizobium galegae]KZA99833.1 XRE family transcriptional regulator [Rhizobium leguminosarum]MBY5361854.1 helix-turn-helix domain-containing protein [Rhizobium leguminosarum]